MSVMHVVSYCGIAGGLLIVLGAMAPVLRDDTPRGLRVADWCVGLGLGAIAASFALGVVGAIVWGW